jgi:hypothetical protein
VAVIELRSLLAQDGVLDQLRAKGFKVTTPGDPPGAGSGQAFAARISRRVRA